MKRDNFSERVLAYRQCALAEDVSNLIPFKALLLQPSECSLYDKVSSYSFFFYYLVFYIFCFHFNLS